MKMLMLLTLAMSLTPAPDATEQDARQLFGEGTTLYESADYEGAIEKFTEALAIARELDLEDKTRLTLLFNIAKAHEKAFKVDQDITHLRQALALYQKYLDFAQETGNLGDELDVELSIARVEKKLQTHAQIQRNVARGAEGPETPPPPSPIVDNTWKRDRNVGLGLVVGGGATVVGGVVLAVVGSQFEPNAQEQVDELADANVPLDHPAWDEAENFVDQEKRKGTVLIGTGVSLAVIGATGLGVGSYYLVKSKKARQVSVAPSFGESFAGVHISGKF